MAQFYNSNCSTINTGCYLYNGPGLTNPVANGYYSDGSNCYTVTGGSGYISNVSVCSTFVTIDYYVPYYAICYNNYTFAATSTTNVNTNVNVEIYWNGDLSGFMSTTVTIANGTSCNTANAYSGGGISCFGENISSTSVILDPSAFGNQIFQVGSEYSIGLAPC
jgi:hypothetical protein